MENVKFRAWHKNKSKMIYGPTDGVISSPWILSLCQSCFMDPMQFVGLYDKNDKEIYEEDIAFCHDEDFHDFIGVVKFKNGHFMIDDNFTSHYFLQDFEIEVIGNIYENSGLLKRNTP